MLGIPVHCGVTDAAALLTSSRAGSCRPDVAKGMTAVGLGAASELPQLREGMRYEWRLAR
jgi:hypothetical protein